MNVHELLEKGSFLCECGRVHQCDTKILRIRQGVLEDLGDILKDYHHVLFISDGNTRPLGGETAINLLEKQGTIVDEVYFNQKEILVPNEKAIARVENNFSDGIELIIGVGSGVINDLSKYVAFSHNIPSMIIATAPSMDGFASSGAVMMLGGLKVTCTCKAPRYIIGDSDVLTNAPMDMIRSGIGDILGKYSALSDWKIANILSTDPMCDLIYTMVEEELIACSRSISAIMQRNPNAIARLMKSLAIVGISLAYQESSRPASGSEHLISHFFELTSLMNKKSYFPHGIDVAYSAIVTEILRKRLLEEDTPSFTSSFNRSAWQKGLYRIFGSEMTQDIISLQEKAKTYTTDRSELIRYHWPEIKSALEQTPGVDFIIKKLEEADFHLGEFVEMYGMATIKDAVRYATDLKTRYTLLELLSDTGYLELYAETLKL